MHSICPYCRNRISISLAEHSKRLTLQIATWSKKKRPAIEFGSPRMEPGYKIEPHGEFSLFFKGPKYFPSISWFVSKSCCKTTVGRPLARAHWQALLRFDSELACSGRGAAATHAGHTVTLALRRLCRVGDRDPGRPAGHCRRTGCPTMVTVTAGATVPSRSGGASDSDSSRLNPGPESR